MILSRRGMLVTMLGLPAAALARPQASALPVTVVRDDGASTDADAVIGWADIEATPGASNRIRVAVWSNANRLVYEDAFVAMHGRPPYRGPRRPS